MYLTCQARLPAAVWENKPALIRQKRIKDRTRETAEIEPTYMSASQLSLGEKGFLDTIIVNSLGYEELQLHLHPQLREDIKAGVTHCFIALSVSAYFPALQRLKHSVYNGQNSLFPCVFQSDAHPHGKQNKISRHSPCHT